MQTSLVSWARSSWAVNDKEEAAVLPASVLHSFEFAVARAWEETWTFHVAASPRDPDVIRTNRQSQHAVPQSQTFSQHSDGRLLTVPELKCQLPDVVATSLREASAARTHGPTSWFQMQSWPARCTRRTRHMQQATCFDAALLDENDTKNEPSLEMEEIGSTCSTSRGQVKEISFEAGGYQNPVPKELASKNTAQIGSFLALRLTYGTPSARDLQKASSSRS